MDAIDKINVFLAQKGMTGADLERQIGVSNSVYSQWNTKSTKPSKKSLLKVADVLGVDVSELLPDTAEKPATNEGSGLSEEAIKIAKAFEAAAPELRKVVETALNLELKVSADYEKIKVTCPIDQTEQVIYQPVYRVGGRVLPERTNNGCDNCHKCKECDDCRQSVAASLLPGADTK